jgi:hypothetical protein
MATLGGEEHVLQHRLGEEQAGVLQRLADAAAGALVLGQPRDVRAGQDDPPGRDRQCAGDELEQRALAGAVGADQSVPGPDWHVEADVVDGLERAEGAAHTGQGQQRLGHADPPGARRRVSSPASPAKPRGST